MALYETPEEMRAKIDEFFDSPPRAKVLSRDGSEYYQAEVVTAGALARFLGFASRQSITHDLAKRTGEGWKELKSYIDDRMEDHFSAIAQVGENPGYGIYRLGCMGIHSDPNKRRFKVDFDEHDSEIEMATKVLMSGGKGELEPAIITSVVQAIKSTADIRKTSELEEMVEQLMQAAGIDK